MTQYIEPAGDNHLETLRLCGGYYACPKDSEGKRLGPLVGYAGKYSGSDGTQLQFVGDIYANFAKAETHTNALKHFARCLRTKLGIRAGVHNIDVFCGAPIGGYSLADALGFVMDIDVVKAEKKITALKTESSREKSQIVFARHQLECNQRVVIGEDVCNNFSTTNELIEGIHTFGAGVLAIVCFLNRSLTVKHVYTFAHPSGFPLAIPVISLVQKPINEWRQDDQAVLEDIAVLTGGKVVNEEG